MYSQHTMADASSYRWYLCVQDTYPAKWSCVRKETEQEALFPYFYGERPVTKAIPIAKWKPRVLDPLILHYSLHPKIGLSM
jgi:hypothetical protein